MSCIFIFRYIYISLHACSCHIQTKLYRLFIKYIGHIMQSCIVDLPVSPGVFINSVSHFKGSFLGKICIIEKSGLKCLSLAPSPHWVSRSSIRPGLVDIPTGLAENAHGVTVDAQSLISHWIIPTLVCWYTLKHSSRELYVWHGPCIIIM